MKEKTNVPRFLLCANQAINDNVYILHTQNPRILFQVVTGAEPSARPVIAFDTASETELADLTKEVLIKFRYGFRKRRET